jgi:hypothetical protein
MNTSNTTVNTPNPPSMADKIARATSAYSKRANHVGGPGLGGAMAGALLRKKPTAGGLGAAAASGVLGMGAIAVGGGHRISSEAAREILKENQGKLGAVMSGYVKSLAGPVKHAQ